MALPDKVYPNTPAPETELPQRTGDPYIGGTLPTEPRMKGLQPLTDNNPDGNLPGIPVSVLGRKGE